MKLAQITKPSKFHHILNVEFLLLASSIWEQESGFVAGNFSRKLLAA
jgi:hypothetical protein